jgi:hypothetical protein
MFVLAYLINVNEVINGQNACVLPLFMTGRKKLFWLGTIYVQAGLSMMWFFYACCRKCYLRLLNRTIYTRAHGSFFRPIKFIRKSSKTEETLSNRQHFLDISTQWSSGVGVYGLSRLVKSSEASFRGRLCQCFFFQSSGFSSELLIYSAIWWPDQAATS